MQQVIQSLQQDSGLKPEQAPETRQPPRGGFPQDHTIQEDMQGLTGKMDGLFGM